MLHPIRRSPFAQDPPPAWGPSHDILQQPLDSTRRQVPKGMLKSDRLRFDGKLRRRGRLVGRLTAAALTPGNYPSALFARAFWYDGQPNFGDALTPWLLRRAGVIPVPATAATAEIAGVGSIIEMLPEDFQGMIWGSGLLYGQETTLPLARFRAVRGLLTRERVDAPHDVALGDPGILVSRFMRRPQVRWEVGFVPHHSHLADPRWRGPGIDSRVRIIDVERGPTAVLRDIARCKRVVSTSLHGLISADPFGIPALWARTEPTLLGDTFKFADYESALTPRVSRRIDVSTPRDLTHSLKHARTLDAAVLRGRQDGLLRALLTAPLRRSNPILIPRYAGKLGATTS